MATIDSLDLASLTNNPEDIAEALEDVLETTSGEIGVLKSAIQTDHDYIEDLRASAQTDHDAIEALVGNYTPQHAYYTSFLNSWSAWDSTTATDEEDGIRVIRIGKIYILHINAYNSTLATGGGSSEILVLDSSIDNPGAEVKLGIQNMSNSTEFDISGQVTLETNGSLRIYYGNIDGSTMWVSGNFIGVDLS